MADEQTLKEVFKSMTLGQKDLVYKTLDVLNDNISAVDRIVYDSLNDDQKKIYAYLVCRGLNDIMAGKAPM